MPAPLPSAPAAARPGDLASRPLDEQLARTIQLTRQPVYQAAEAKLRDSRAAAALRGGGARLAGKLRALGEAPEAARLKDVARRLSALASDERSAHASKAGELLGAVRARLERKLGAAGFMLDGGAAGEGGAGAGGGAGMGGGGSSGATARRLRPMPCSTRATPPCCITC